MIKDSGTRTDFASGAVRDMGKGKGRFELLPLTELTILEFGSDSVMTYMRTLKQEIEQNEGFASMKVTIGTILKYFRDDYYTECPYNTLLRLAVHAEEGAEKYGDLNWQKGIPLMSYFNSAMRHYCKYRAGWKDEPHEIAFIWTLAALLWTRDTRKEEET